MSDKEYEAPKVEAVNSEDHPSVTAAGARRQRRPLTSDGSKMTSDDTYEAPVVQTVNTEDHPSVTAAGDTSDAG